MGRHDNRLLSRNWDYPKNYQTGRVKLLAWNKPAMERKRLLASMVTKMKSAFVLCFRAKEKIQPVPGREPIQLGWQPISGDDFAYEMTVRCLLPPGSNGIPDWSPAAFAHETAKRGEKHRALVPDGAQLDEKIGEALALWAKGSKPEISYDELVETARKKAIEGVATYSSFWQSLEKSQRAELKEEHEKLKELANLSDANRADAELANSAG